MQGVAKFYHFTQRDANTINCTPTTLFCISILKGKKVRIAVNKTVTANLKRNHPHFDQTLHGDWTVQMFDGGIRAGMNGSQGHDSKLIKAPVDTISVFCGTHFSPVHHNQLSEVLHSNALCTCTRAYGTCTRSLDHNYVQYLQLTKTSGSRNRSALLQTSCVINCPWFPLFLSIIDPALDDLLIICSLLHWLCYTQGLFTYIRKYVQMYVRTYMYVKANQTEMVLKLNFMKLTAWHSKLNTCHGHYSIRTFWAFITSFIHSFLQWIPGSNREPAQPMPYFAHCKCGQVQRKPQLNACMSRSECCTHSIRLRLGDRDRHLRSALELLPIEASGAHSVRSLCYARTHTLNSDQMPKLGYDWLISLKMDYV